MRHYSFPKHFFVLFLHFEPARVQPLYGAGRKESSWTELHTCSHIPTHHLNLDRLVFLKVYMTRNFFISLFERAFKMMKNGVDFIMIALLVAELVKILVYVN